MTNQTEPAKKTRARRPTRINRADENPSDLLYIPDEWYEWAKENQYHLGFVRYYLRNGQVDIDNAQMKFAQGWRPVTIGELPGGDWAGSGSNPFLKGAAKNLELDDTIRRGQLVLAKIPLDVWNKYQASIERQALQHSRQYMKEYREAAAQKRGIIALDESVFE